jgi:hypothetical protein
LPNFVDPGIVHEAARNVVEMQVPSSDGRAGHASLDLTPWHPVGVEEVAFVVVPAA